MGVPWSSPRGARSPVGETATDSDTFRPKCLLGPSSLLRSDASLYCDDVDIRFSKTMNSCKVLQIRYASVERLLERLTDLRFLSIDFLNTFLHSYRVFTTAVVVLDKLITIYRKPISAIPARWAGLLLPGRPVELLGPGGRRSSAAGWNLSWGVEGHPRPGSQACPLQRGGGGLTCLMLLLSPSFLYPPAWAPGVG